VRNPTNPHDGGTSGREPRRCNSCTARVPLEPMPPRRVNGIVSARPVLVGTEIHQMRTLWLPELQAFDQAELEWQMMRRRLHPVQLAEVAGVSTRTLYRALSGHRTQRRNAFAILTALNRAPVAIPA
jgi:hypothetical protein